MHAINDSSLGNQLNYTFRGHLQLQPSKSWNSLFVRWLQYTDVHHTLLLIAERSVECLKHDQQNEIFLDCGPDHLIHILRAQHGHAAAQNTSNCTYQEADECGVALPNMEYLRDHCMGRHQCTAGVSPLFLDPCGRESNYVQVLYDCVSGENWFLCCCRGCI